ncbi:MAG: hypothetical protein ACREXG_01785 [Polaromonas sp.]
MNERQLAVLLQRVDRLERENQRWKRIAVLSIIVLGAAAVMGQALRGPTALEAQKFVLKDSSGRVRGVWGAQDPPYPTDQVSARYGLHLYAADGRKIGAWGERLGSTGSVLELHDQRTASAAYLSAGSAQIGTGEHAFRAAASLDLTATEETREASEHRGAELRRKLAAAKTPEETDEILRAASSYGVHARLNAFTKGTSELYIKRGRSLDSRGAVNLSVTKEGQPALMLQDEDGIMRSTLGETALKRPDSGAIEQRPVSSLVFFNKHGQVIWKAP